MNHLQSLVLPSSRAFIRFNQSQLLFFNKCDLSSEMPVAKVISIKGKLDKLKLISIGTVAWQVFIQKAMAYSLGENIYKH